MQGAGSRVDFFGNHAEDDVLISSPHHQAELVVFLNGRADVAGRADRLPVDADDDVALLQAAAVKKRGKRTLTSSGRAHVRITRASFIQYCIIIIIY